MKLAMTIAMAMVYATLPLTANAKGTNTFYLVNGKTGTKIDAVKAMLSDERGTSAVARCTPVMLTPSLAIKTVPQARK